MAKNINQLVPDLKKSLIGFIQELADDIEEAVTVATPTDSGYAKTQWEQQAAPGGLEITVGNTTDYLVYPEVGTVDQPAQLFTKRAVDVETSKIRVVKKK